MPVHAKELANFKECKENTFKCIERLLVALKEGLCAETEKKIMWCYKVLPPLVGYPIVKDDAIGVVFAWEDGRRVAFAIVEDDDVLVQTSLYYGAGLN